LFCSLLGITYPAFIFNTSATKSALGYLEELEDVGIARISSVATEPSIFAGFMLIAFVFALFALLRKKPLISKMWDRLGTGIIFVALLISTSTTAYVGLAFIGTVYLIVIYRLDILHRKHIVGLVWLLVSVVLIVGLIPAAQDIFSTLVVGKSENYSGIARAYSIALAAEYFLQYPILGLGWGSVTSHDLVFKILSNTGVIGLLAFSMFAISLFKRLWRGTAGDADPEWRIWYGCVLAAYLVLLFTNATTGFAFVFEHVWFLFGLAMAVPVLSSAVAVPSYRPPNLGAPKVVAT
jgi:O-antigen ligase